MIGARMTIAEQPRILPQLQQFLPHQVQDALHRGLAPLAALSRSDASASATRRKCASADELLPRTPQARAFQHDAAQRDEEIARRDDVA